MIYFMICTMLYPLSTRRNTRGLLSLRDKSSVIAVKEINMTRSNHDLNSQLLHNLVLFVNTEVIYFA